MIRWMITATALALLTAAAQQDVALKNLMPTGMVIGVAINQRQSDAVDTAAVDLITKQFNQISPENVLKSQPLHPAMYTELDVNLLPNTPRGADPATANPYANGLPDGLQQQLARRYADVFRLFLAHRDAVTRVTFRGLSDGDSWLNRGRMNYPLLWDRERKPKPAFDAVVDALRRAR